MIYSARECSANDLFIETTYNKGGKKYEAFHISTIRIGACPYHERHSIRGSEKEHVRRLSPEGNAGRSTAAP
jgi:hypothetical protein